MTMVARELFELEMLGGTFERRYRKMRPEVERMPWGTLGSKSFSPSVRVAAQQAWTTAAFQEHRSGVACSATLRAMMEIRAPLDLIALATRFPLDEMVHVELCARMAMEIGGGIEIVHDPSSLVMDADPSLAPLVRALDLGVRVFCVGEALSIPLLRGTWHAAAHPLPRAVLGRIAKDEAAHGAFGFVFLDWALPRLDRAALEQLGQSADTAIDGIVATWDELRKRPRVPESEAHPLRWMESQAYLDLAARSLKTHVIGPLLARGIPLSPRGAEGRRRGPRSSA